MYILNFCHSLSIVIGFVFLLWNSHIYCLRILFFAFGRNRNLDKVCHLYWHTIAARQIQATRVFSSSNLYWTGKWLFLSCCFHWHKQHQTAYLSAKTCLLELNLLRWSVNAMYLQFKRVSSSPKTGLCWILISFCIGSITMNIKLKISTPNVTNSPFQSPEMYIFENIPS